MLLSNSGMALVIHKLFYLTIGGMLVTQLWGCQPAMITIDRVAAQKSGKIVYLSGQVTHLAPFIDNVGAYQLQDSRDKIWVVTQNSLPPKNSQITIKGKIEYQSLPFDERDLGGFYVIELERQKRK
jgi:hypothetical protein